VIDGHTLSIAVKCHKTPSVEDAVQVLASYQGSEVTRNLPSSPNKPIIVRVEPDRPQPRRDRTAGNGMSVTVGRIRPCPILDLRMVSVVHNTLRGAASGAIMNAELLVESGYV
jgi:aspartate-semialdehyde dehydrogenase